MDNRSNQRLQIFSEDQLQSTCFQWHWNNYPHERGMLFHVNQKSRNAVEGNRMKAMGVVPGVSDMVYLKGPVFIEMKSDTGKQSPDQKRFQELTEALGYRYVICRSFEEFKEIILT